MPSALSRKRETEHAGYRRGEPGGAGKTYNPDVGSRFVEPGDAPASGRRSNSLDNGLGDDSPRVDRFAVPQARHDVEDGGRCRPSSDARCAVAAVVDRDGLDCLSHKPTAFAGYWAVFACSSSGHLSAFESAVPPAGPGSGLGASGALPPPDCGW